MYYNVMSSRCLSNITDAVECSGYNNTMRSISLKEAYEFIIPTLKSPDDEESPTGLWHFVPHCKVSNKYIGESVSGYKVRRML